MAEPARRPARQRRYINWRRVYGVMREHDWTWADLARRMGVTEPHLSMMRNGHRNESLVFIECLAVAVQLNWEQVLHPIVDRVPSAREVLALTAYDDGRPWTPTKHDTRTKYQQFQREQELERTLDAFQPPTRDSRRA